MLDLYSQFHFIRPVWFLALVPVLVIVACLILKGSRKNQWTSSIDQHLLIHLLVNQKKIQQSSMLPLIALTLSLLLAVLALAGPTWEKKPLPVFETEISKVILFDLSLSMESTDLKPSRLIRAKHKIKDLLSKTNEGQVALIVYAGDAFVISPLTTDANTILTMIPPLAPSLMPVLGSQPDRAFTLATELLTNAGVFSGQIIWITDGIDDQDYGLVSDQIEGSRHQISILAVGTKEGAPIPLPDGQGFLKDASGKIVLPSLKLAPLEQLAEMNNGTVTRLTADDQDINTLISSLKAPEEFIISEDELEMDTWVELGPWLLLPLILVVALAFRKGLVVTLLLTIIPLFPSPTHAAEQPAPNQNNGQEVVAVEESSGLNQFWDDLWKTPDQQAAEAFNNNQHSAAADLFQQSDWKSAAMYKSGQFNAASDLLSTSKSATAQYNRGNALAQIGKLEQAIEAYDQAIQQAPGMEDAKFNKTLVEDMLKQQQEQEQQQQEQQNQDGEQGEQEQQDGEQQEGEEQGEQEQQQQSESQDGEQQEGEEQEGEQQKTELEQMTEAEREQVLEQWLRMIKDDPGGLLRRKMYMEYQRRQQQGKKLQDKGEKVW